MDAGQVREIARRFPGRWLQGYVRGKLGSDPVYAAAISLLMETPHPVLDIGCGIGLLAQALRAAGNHSEYLGLDLDAHKLALARSAAASLPAIRFVQSDATVLPDWHGYVLLLDVLHYLDHEAQQTLLKAAAARLAPGAALVIRSVLRDRSWRFRVTQLEEMFMRSVRWMRYGVRHYPTADELRGPLRDAGLALSLAPLWARTPFNSYLLIARRTATD